MLVLLLAIALHTGCGKELGRIPFSAEGIAERTVTLESGEVNFWTDLDIRYEGDAMLGYEVTLQQAGTVVGRGVCEALGPLSITTMWVQTDLGDSHSRSGRGKMSCSTTLAKGGATVVRARLAFSRRPGAATLSKADLVIKQ